jgi:putative nucleotidyltransferase with HDIG domain
VTTRALEHLEALDDLPSPSPVLGHLLATLGRAAVGLADIEDILRRDPVIAAKVVAAANAAAWASRGRTETLRAALLRLGLDRVRRLALVTSLYNTSGARAVPVAFWRHSVAVAHVAEALALADGDGDVAPTAFFAALVHDLGWLVVHSHCPAEAREIGRLTAGGVALVAAERQVLGRDHAAVGVRLAAHWALPEAVVEAVQAHHAATRGPHVVAALVSAADEWVGRDPAWRLIDTADEDEGDRPARDPQEAVVSDALAAAADAARALTDRP